MTKTTTAVLVLAAAIAAAQADTIQTGSGRVDGYIARVDSHLVYIRLSDGNMKLVPRDNPVFVTTREAPSQSGDLPSSSYSAQPMSPSLVFSAGSQLSKAGSLMGAGWALAVAGGLASVLLAEAAAPPEIAIGIPVAFGACAVGLNVAAIVNLRSAGTLLQHSAGPKRW